MVVSLVWKKKVIVVTDAENAANGVTSIFPIRRDHHVHRLQAGAHAMTTSCARGVVRERVRFPSRCLRGESNSGSKRDDDGVPSPRLRGEGAQRADDGRARW
jgi:hypothetical protein